MRHGIRGEAWRIALLCATHRGYRFLQKLLALVPDAELFVFSFREEPWEPPFVDDIRTLAESHGHRFFTARNVGSPRWRSFWETTPLDLMLVVSWRYLIPPEVFRRPRQGTFVWHDSLLPAYRGFSPTVWAILNGEDHTGVTLFEMAEEVDSGDIVDQERVPIGPDDPIRVVMERVTEAYLTLLERNLEALLAGTAPRRPQDPSRATYTCKRLPQDNRIDWKAPTAAVYNLIRAVSAPYPGAYTFLDGRKLIVWAARRLPDAPRYVGRVPGRVVEVRPGEGVVVLTGDGALLLTEVQPEGMPPVCAAEVLQSLSQTLE
jgi:methionyl-tRNA formyltransferase